MGANNAGHGSLKWWANRKSRMGLRPSAKPAPHLPGGREWWCEPPTSTPEPAHIEYATLFMLELCKMPDSKQTVAMKAHVAAWLRAAKRLCHERMAVEYGGIATTDDLIVEASIAIHSLAAIVVNVLGPEKIYPRTRQAIDALQGKADEIKRRRAMDPAHPVKAARRG